MTAENKIIDMKMIADFTKEQEERDEEYRCQYKIDIDDYYKHKRETGEDIPFSEFIYKKYFEYLE